MAERYRLRFKRIDKVSLVDKPDNPEARVVIAKRAEEPMEKTEKVGLFKQLAQALGLTEADVKVEPKKDEPVNNKAEIEAIAKRVEEAEKRAKDAEQEVAKLRLDARTAEFTRKAETLYTSLPGKAAEKATVLRKVADGEKLTDDEQKLLEKMLRAGNEAMAQGLFEEIGSDAAPASGTAAARANAKAAELRKADPKLSEAAALAQVYKSDSKLMREVEREEQEVVKSRLTR